MEIDAKELAWASGLFEGEGSILLHRNRETKMLYANVSLAMSDEDSVRRFQEAVGGLGSVHVRPASHSQLSTLPLFDWRANSFENAQAVIAMLWYGLGARRRARATEVLRAVKESQVHRKNMRRGSECWMEECHSPVSAKGLCNKHYLQARAVVFDRAGV